MFTCVWVGECVLGGWVVYLLMAVLFNVFGRVVKNSNKNYVCHALLQLDWHRAMRWIKKCFIWDKRA